MDEKYPVGTRVVLEDGKIGTVTGYSLNLKTESGDVKVDLDKAVPLTIVDEMSMLPDELQAEIGKYLDRSDIISLSEVSKKSHHLSGVMYDRKIHRWKPKNRAELDEAISYFSRTLKFMSERSIRKGFRLYGHPNTWDVSGITNMNKLFTDMDFNYDISDWDVSNVTKMSYMFKNNVFFNQKIGKWDVSNVKYMTGMFADTNFDQDISAWDVSNVLQMIGMFRYNHGFEEDSISSWTYNPGVTKNNMFEPSATTVLWDVENLDFEVQKDSGSFIDDSYPEFQEVFDKLPFEKRKMVLIWDDDPDDLEAQADWALL